MQKNNPQVVIYQSADGKPQIEVRLESESLWLTLQQIADLFERDKSVVSRHLKSIFDTKELTKEATVAKNATVQYEGERQITRQLEYYNLDAVLSVGYRVSSARATQFRIWATQRLMLYFVVKNHPFADGNKRSAAFLLEDFLYRNQRLFNTQGELVINDTGLAALTLLVAESNPAQKETVIRLIEHMLSVSGG